MDKISLKQKLIAKLLGSKRVIPILKRKLGTPIEWLHLSQNKRFITGFGDPTYNGFGIGEHNYNGFGI